MIVVESAQPDDLPDVVSRITREHALVTAENSLIDARVDRAILSQSLESSLAGLRVAKSANRVVGHLRGVALASRVFGNSAWIAPDCFSFDAPDVLDDLYNECATEWLAAGVDQHYVWTAGPPFCAPWLNLGFAYMHQRATMRLEPRRTSTLPAGYVLRRGGLEDLDVALELDDVLRIAQEAGPSFALHLADTGQREEWIETLEDPDVAYFIVEHDGVAVAQCSTFPVPERLGSFDRSIHLSAVVVVPDHQNVGVATALVSTALDVARQDGFRYAETNWRVTNRRAARYWQNFGFTPTYLRLHRHVGDG